MPVRARWPDLCTLTERSHCLAYIDDGVVEILRRQKAADGVGRSTGRLRQADAMIDAPEAGSVLPHDCFGPIADTLRLLLGIRTSKCAHAIRFR